MAKGVRLVWLDVTRAILILFVVIGHSTGIFNGYIYQFHMAAFFMLSGYTTHYERKSLGEFVFTKWMRLMQPFIYIFLVGVLVSGLLNRAGIYHIFFPAEQVYIGAVNMIRELLYWGNNYVWWMGACWFILTLFAASCLQSVLNYITNRFWIRAIITTALTIFAKYSQGGEVRFGIFGTGKVIFIASLFVLLGEAARRISLIDRLFSKNGIRTAILTIIFLGIHIAANKILHYTVDWTTEEFNVSTIGVIISICDTLLYIGIALLISRFVPLLGSLLSSLGRQTLPVVFFFFFFFKVGNLVLIAVGLLPKESFNSFLPPDGVSNRFWWLYTIIAITCCVVLWRILLSFPVIKKTLGQDKVANEKCWEQVKKILRFQRQ